MSTFRDRLRTRLIPALLTALGVWFIAVGLLWYTNPASAGDTGPAGSPSPTLAGGSDEPSPSPSLITFPPVASASPGPSDVVPSPSPVDRVATRVVIPALDIDLPVVKPPGGNDTYPLCDVAMYLQELHQPGEPGATYLYAHAREGMFLPLLEQSRINGGRRMIGMIVSLYTSDDMLYLYEIREVRRHVPFDGALDDAFAATTEQLWLQTSEGVGRQPKLQVVALPISFGPADHEDAHPTPRPVVCGP